MAAIFPSVISSFFTQNKRGGADPAGPSPRSAIGYLEKRLSLHYLLVLGNKKGR